MYAYDSQNFALSQQVNIGKYFKSSVGYVKYIDTSVQNAGGIEPGILAIVIIAVLVVIAAIVLVVLLKKKRMGPFRDPHEKQFRYVQGQDGLDLEGQRLVDQNRQNGNHSEHFLRINLNICAPKQD